MIYVTEIFIVRHCETDGNAQKIFQGHIDLDINELGTKQLDALSKSFHETHLDKIFTSPLLRAKKTALAIRGNKDIPIVINEGLIELNGGAYEAKTYSQIGKEFPDFNEIWVSRPWDFAPENGEKMTDAYERIWSTVKAIAAENKDKRIVIVSHGGVIRCLLCKILKNDITKMCEIPFGSNTAVSLLKFEDNGKYYLDFFNNDDHLGDSLKNLNAKVPMGEN